MNNRPSPSPSAGAGDVQALKDGAEAIYFVMQYMKDAPVAGQWRERAEDSKSRLESLASRLNGPKPEDLESLSAGAKP